MKDKNISKARQARFLEFVRNLHLEFPVADLVEKTGYSKGTISKYLNSAVDVSLDFYETFLKSYNLKDEFTETEPPSVNEPSTGHKADKKREVIALGKKVPTRLNADEFAEAFPDWDGVPVFNVEVSAGFVSHYRDENKWDPLYYLRDPQFKECSFAARIAGDSMHSEIRHGDYIICQEIADPSIIVFGDIYYVVARNGLQTCKYINAFYVYDREIKEKVYDFDKLLLVPKNDSISPTPLHRNDIVRLYKVRGIIRGY